MKLRRYIVRRLLYALCGALIIGGGVVIYLIASLPSVEVLKDVKLQTPMRVYSREGALIGQFGEKKRTPLLYAEIPPLFVQALLAAEDDAFFSHVGIDFPSLIRATLELLMTGHKGSGGSTLTMQVARNYFLSLERTFTRKFKEILLSLEIERHLSKEEILELYFNQMFLGHRAYGFEAAAQVYYGARIGELNLAQLAMLAGLPKAPSRYNPLANPHRALIRRNWILARMLSLEYIAEAEYQQALQAPVSASHHGARLVINAPYAAEMARSEMLRRYGSEEAYGGGYHVYTTISGTLQQVANRAVNTGLLRYDERHGYRGPERQFPAAAAEHSQARWLTELQQIAAVDTLLPAIVTRVQERQIEVLLDSGARRIIDWDDGLRQARRYIHESRRGAPPETAAELFSAGDQIRVTEQGARLLLGQLPVAQAALVSMRPQDGAILSMVGGTHFADSKFNRITQALRQPGSSFKPFIYAAALEYGFTAASIINDAPVVFEDTLLEDTWRPENDGGKFYGPTRLRWALTQSRNLVSIRLLQAQGISNAVEYVKRFGFDPSKLAANLSLALGTHVITPLQAVTAYASLANGGYRVEPYLVQRVENFYREPVYTAEPATVCRPCERALQDAAAEPPAAGQEELSMAEILRGSRTPEGLPVAPRIMDERVAYIVNSILQDVIVRGTGRKARVLQRRDLAGKTGTTNGPRDAWFSGYNADVATTTWVGFDQNWLLGNNEFGGSAALPVWIDFMRVALADSPQRVRPVPEGIVSVRIDPGSGLLARPGQRDAIFEYFRVENVPTQSVPQPPPGPGRR